MKKTAILCKEEDKLFLGNIVQAVQEIWKDRGYESTVIPVSQEISPDNYMNMLVRLDADFLVTFGMAGFEWRALMEQVRYNTLFAKQIHILMGNLTHYDYYLRKEYGIQCFFFTDNEGLFEDWKRKYPLLPYFEKIPPLRIAGHLTKEEKLANRENLERVMDKVISFVEKPSVL